VPARVALGKAAVVLFMIRRPEAPGLRGILEVEAVYGVGSEDVRSTGSFPVKFPLDAAGQPTATELIIKVEAPDFEPRSQSKSIEIEPSEDSALKMFLLTPMRPGDLNVHLELVHGTASLADCLLRTTAVAADEPAGSRSHRVVSMALGAETHLQSDPSVIDTI